MGVGAVIGILGAGGVVYFGLGLRPLAEAMSDIENRRIWTGKASETPGRFEIEPGVETVATVWWLGTRPTGLSVHSAGGAVSFEPNEDAPTAPVRTLARLGRFEGSGGEYTVEFEGEGSRVTILPFSREDWEAADRGARGVFWGLWSLLAGGLLVAGGLVMGLAIRGRCTREPCGPARGTAAGRSLHRPGPSSRSCSACGTMRS